jgi:hypothetical protein
MLYIITVVITIRKTKATLHELSSSQAESLASGRANSAKSGWQKCSLCSFATTFQISDKEFVSSML